MATETHVVDVTIRLELDREVTEEVREALDALADVMLVQAEDGLYTLGRPETEGEVGVENVLEAEIPHAEVVQIVEVEST